MLIVGERLDCGLVVDAYINVGVGSGRGGGDEAEAFVYGV
jgi:hypothetical protein